MENKTINTDEEKMSVVIVGHVDHGKSTVIGRLLADTGSLPEGKLERVKKTCERNARPFEYAFLLDALVDEQSQGITIDSARCFFNTAKRRYIIIDAPGHTEFLKNMITGASRADAALLVIDAHEGIKENSRRHGFMTSMLGIKHVVVLVNKMDLAGYGKGTFDDIVAEFSAYLARIGTVPLSFIPVSAMNGDNIVARSRSMAWYSGPTVVEMIDALPAQESLEHSRFRMPLQDVYKFTEGGDERRIFAGTIASGTVRAGDEVRFLPSGKKSRVLSIEGFGRSGLVSASAGEATGFTLATQVYVKPGEIVHRADETPPSVSRSFEASVFWVGRSPMARGKTYKLKIGTGRASVSLVTVNAVLDADDLESYAEKAQIERHDVAECVLETVKPIAFDTAADNQTCGRFVIVDGYEIAGGGIVRKALESEESVVERHARERDSGWVRGFVTTADRIARNGHKPKFVVLSGDDDNAVESIAKALELALYNESVNVYYLGLSNMTSGLASDMRQEYADPDEKVRRLGELAHLFTEAGMLLIATVPGIEQSDVEVLETLNRPGEILFVRYGGEVSGMERSGLSISAECPEADAVRRIRSELASMEVLQEYSI